MNLERQARQAKFNRTIAFPMAVFGLLALAIAVCVVLARPDTPMPTRQGPPLAPVTTPTTTPRDDHPCLNNSDCPGYTPPRTATTPTTPDWSVYCYQHQENTMECGPATADHHPDMRAERVGVVWSGLRAGGTHLDDTDAAHLDDTDHHADHPLGAGQTGAAAADHRNIADGAGAVVCRSQ
jgi:hypothetical protein